MASGLPPPVGVGPTFVRVVGVFVRRTQYHVSWLMPLQSLKTNGFQAMESAASKLVLNVN